MTTLLALDLGTTTGFCVGPSGNCISGVWDLKPSRYDGGGMRFVKFLSRLDEIFDAVPPDIVVYEEVRRHNGTDAAHVYGGLMGHLQSWCEDKKLPYEGVPLAAIKKYWTGKGNANKDAMIAACADRGLPVVDDNEADAVALWHFKILEHGGA